MFCLLPFGEMAEDSLRDLNNEIVSPEASLRAKKLTKLLLPPIVRAMKCKKF